MKWEMWWIYKAGLVASWWYGHRAVYDAQSKVEAKLSKCFEREEQQLEAG